MSLLLYCFSENFHVLGHLEIWILDCYKKELEMTKFL